MSLPERQHYSLDKAVKKINSYIPDKEHIDLDDLLHYALIGEIELFYPASHSIDLGKQEVIELGHSFITEEYDFDSSNEIAEWIKGKLNKERAITLLTNYGEIDIYNIRFIKIENENFERIDLLLEFISSYLRISYGDIDKLKNGQTVKTNTFLMPQTIVIENDNFPNNFDKVLPYVIFPVQFEFSINDVVITKEELDRFTQQIQDDSFTIEDYQNILFSLKELVCSKAKKWSQDEINNELDNLLKGMSKRRLESMWSKLNKKYKS